MVGTKHDASGGTGNQLCGKPVIALVVSVLLLAVYTFGAAHG